MSIRTLFRRKRVYVPIFALAVAVCIVARPAWVLIHAALTDRDDSRPIPSGMVDDASRLDQAPANQIWDVPIDSAAAEIGLRRLIAEAREKHLQISIAGARHSMGGQTISPGGIQINMLTHCGMQLDAPGRLLHVQAGARWSQVLPFLDASKLSVAIMQSNNDFSVGGSISVNCHGWQFDRPPIDSTVESLRIMLADGSIKTCSRIENPELFSLTLGGYGLFGIILDVDLRLAMNERYEVEQYAQPTSDFLAAWSAHLQPASQIGMGLGRLSIAPDNFLNDSLLYVLRRAPLPNGDLPALGVPAAHSVARAIFLASAESDYGKTLRWEAEKHLLTHLEGRYFTRNQLLDEPAELYANLSDATTDVLQEYFVPANQFAQFVAALRQIVPRDGGNLLNVTIRDIREDRDCLLRYADQDVIALVLLYRQNRTAPATEQMARLTRESIDAALACGGRYYLPYRLDATQAQFQRAYPMAKKFFELKRQYDPGEIFQNELYQKYGRS